MGRFTLNISNNPEPDPWDAALRELIKDENERTPVTEQIARDIAMNRKAEKSIRDDIKTETDKRLELDKRIQDLRAEIEKLAEGRMEISAKLKKLRQELTTIGENIKALERNLQFELEKIRQGLKFKSSISKFDIITENCEWRNKAKNHQLEGGYFMAMTSAILADKMGLGKTLTCLIAADMAEVQRLLIVCQGDITNNFASEVRRWAPHRGVINMYKMSKEQRDNTLFALSMADKFTLLINYDAWRKDKALVDKLAALGFEAIILDEGHNVKSSSTSAYQGVRDIRLAENCCPMCQSLKVSQFKDDIGIFRWQCKLCNWKSNDGQKYEIHDRRSVKFVWFATGTPILNKPQELFTALSLIIPGVFKHEREFLDVYCEQDWSGYWKWRPGGELALQEHLGGRYLMRDRKTLEAEGIFLPKQQIIVHELDIDPVAYPAQHRVINQLKKHAQFILESGKKITAIHTLQLITWQRQANVYPAGIKMKDEDGNIVFQVGEEVNESIKVDWAVKQLDEFYTDGRRSVVFSQFTGPLHEIKRRLDSLGIRAVVYDGSTPQEIRRQIAVDFDRTHCDRPGYEKKWDVVLANYRTGGTGLNFTSATCTVVVDEEWNPGKNQQAWGRTDRIGQTEENYVHICRLNSTVDQWMVKLNEFKANVVQGFNTASLDMQQEYLEALRNNEV